MYIKATPGDNPAARIWYIVENKAFRNLLNVTTYRIESEHCLTEEMEAGTGAFRNLYPSDIVINQEPLTMAEARALHKLLTGVQS